ncbi:uncharacterized protein LOC135929615 [Gordionus sp. m RMFG-2023]|uniref:uncharacterized protein LOC135929615 n=1 Tax=Gordionus sp. m RMFG-2023 TaxID=3053472 RepID=UPI0031FD8D6B
MLTPNEWCLAKKVNLALLPIQRITKEISGEKASISIVIPFVELLKKELTSHGEYDKGVQTMKDAMNKDLTKRFSSIYNDKIYFIATILDPRFKTIFFSIQSISNFYRQKLLLVCFDSNPGEIINSSSLEKDNQNMEIKEIPSTSAMDSTGIFNLWGSYADVVKDNEKSNNITGVNCPYSLEIENYINEPVFKALNDNTPADPLKYWAVIAKNIQPYLNLLVNI